MNAYERTVRDHHALVYRVALGIVRDPSTAEDVTQDVFLDFLRHPEPLARAGNVRAFVGRAAVHRALKQRRGSERRDRRELAWSETRRAVMDPVELAFRNELRAKVADLPEDQRVAVDLHFFQGFTMREAGLVLDVPTGTVSSRISSGLASLRRAISAAAFVALLASLERELSACEAPVVPQGLASRLMSLDPAVTGHDLTSGASRKSVLASGAFVLALLLAVTTGKWIVSTRDGEASAESSAVIAAVDRPTEDVLYSLNDGSDPTDAESAPALPADEAIAALPSFEETTLEGFLVRSGERLYIAVERVPEPGHQAQWDFIPLGDAGARPIDSGLLGGYPAGSTADFGPFLTGSASTFNAPHTRVKVRARVPRQDSAGQELVSLERVQVIESLSVSREKDAVGALLKAVEALNQVQVRSGGLKYLNVTPPPEVNLLSSRFEVATERLKSARVAIYQISEDRKVEVQGGDGAMTIGDNVYVPMEFTYKDEPFQSAVNLLHSGELRELAAAEVLEILEVELLSDSWLEAWRDMYCVACELPALEQDQPVNREALAVLARRLGAAMNNARLSRAGQHPVTWRVRMENRYASSSYAVLSAAGFDPLLPRIATPWSLRSMFLEASGPEDLRARVTAEFGMDALELMVQVNLVLEIDLGTENNKLVKREIRLTQIQPGWQHVPVAELLAMDAETFAGVQAATRGGLQNPPVWETEEFTFEESPESLPGVK